MLSQRCPFYVCSVFLTACTVPAWSLGWPSPLSLHSLKSMDPWVSLAWTCTPTYPLSLGAPSPGKNHVSLCFYLWLSRDTIGWPILSARPAYSISLMVNRPSLHNYRHYQPFFLDYRPSNLLSAISLFLDNYYRHYWLLAKPTIGQALNSTKNSDVPVLVLVRYPGVLSVVVDRTLLGRWECSKVLQSNLIRTTVPLGTLVLRFQTICADCSKGL